MVNDFATALNCVPHCYLLASPRISCFLLYFTAVNFSHLYFKPLDISSMLISQVFGVKVHVIRFAVTLSLIMLDMAHLSNSLFTFQKEL